MDSLRTNRIRIIFICSAALLMLLSVLSYYRIGGLHKSAELVNHTTEVKLNLQNIYISVSEADSGVRGFILFQDSSYIDRVNIRLSELDTQLENLKNQTADNYSQRANLVKLREIVKRRIDYMFYLLRESRKQKIQKEQWLGARKIMDELRTHLAHMGKEEDMLLKLRQQVLDEDLLVTPLFTVFLTVAALLILVASYLMVNRELNISNELRRDLLQSKNDLETNNAILEQRNKSLDKMNKELESFTYISSHDLQEPLRKMQTFISRIIDKDREKLSDTGQTYLKRTQDAAHRLQNLIQDLLAYSRVNKEIFPSKQEDLYLLVNEIRDELSEEITASKAVIEVKGSKEIQIIGSQFRQLLLNLVSNAIKFTAKTNEPHIVIENTTVKEFEIEGAKKTDRLFSKITVSDNGIGFDPTYKDRIFEVFQRLHTREEYSGTGIGLAIVKKIVENHNGYVFAESSEGSGATFTIYIPVTH